MERYGFSSAACWFRFFLSVSGLGKYCMNWVRMALSSEVHGYLVGAFLFAFIYQLQFYR